MNKDSIKQEQWKQFQREELHKTALNAYVNNEITFDRLLLAINLAAIGFISKYLFECDFENFIEKIVAYLLLFSIIFLLISSYKILEIFKRNKLYLQNLLDGRVDNDEVLEKLDSDKLRSLKIGVLFFLIALIVFVFEKLYF